MPNLTINGASLPVRLVEVELSKLRLDPENPRLHSAYLTHALPADPTQKQIEAVLAALPEAKSLTDALIRNEGCFTAPLVSSDFRALEGNRRIAALRRLRAESPRSTRWTKLTVQQVTVKLTPDQEKAVRAKYHLEGIVPWDGLSQLTEYAALAERERNGAETVAEMLGRFPKDVEPLLVAGRCLRTFSRQYPQVRSSEALWVIAGLCGVKHVAPSIACSRSTRFLFTDSDETRPEKQPYATAKIFRWVAEGRFTTPYAADGRQTIIRISQVPAQFRRVLLAGGEPLALFCEEGGSLAKAVASLDGAGHTVYSKHRRALQLTRTFVDLLNEMPAIRREETPELYRDALSCYQRLGILLGVPKKEKAYVHAGRR
jgi:hypothetical protein